MIPTPPRCPKCRQRHPVPHRFCQPRWARILDAVRAERNDAAAARAELEEEKKISDVYAAQAEAGEALAAALRVALGHENVLDESPDLFQIRRLMDDFEKERFD